MNVLNSLEKEKKETYKSIFDLPLNDPSAEVFDSSDEDQAKDSNYSAELSTQATIDSAKPFEVGDIDPKKDGGSVAPKIEDKSEAVDKPEVDESDEKKKAKLKEQIGQYNKKIEEALELEKEADRLGKLLGATTTELAAAIVNEEGAWHNPGISPSVRARQIEQITKVSDGDSTIKQAQSELGKNLEKLESLGKSIEGYRAKIKSIFSSLLEGCKNKYEITLLQEFLRGLDIRDDEIQLQQKNEVEEDSSYKILKEKLLADSVAAMARHSKSLLKQVEEPVINAIVEEKAKIDLPTSEPTVDEPAAEATDDSKKVSFETFSPSKAPDVETKDAPEVQKFEANDLKAPGVTEESIKNGQRIDDIKKTLNGPPLQMPTPGADINIAMPENAEPKAEAGVEEIKDLQGEKLKVDLNKPEDGGGVEINASSDVPKEEQTIPETAVSEVPSASTQPNIEMPVQAQEGTNEVATPASEAPKTQPQMPEVPKAEAEVPKVETPQVQPQTEPTQAPDDATKKKEAARGGIVGALKHFFRIGNKAEANDVAQIEKDLKEERKPKEETENKG